MSAEINMTTNNGLMSFGEEVEENQPLWFSIEDKPDNNDIANLTFREANIIIEKLLPNVSDIIVINQNKKSIRFKSIKKFREQILKTDSLGSKKCKITEVTKLNYVKGTIFHPSLTETTDEELLEDLQRDNVNIKDCHIFTKFVNGRKINTQNAVVTFDSLNLPPQVVYLKFTILRTRQYYPNPTRCSVCWRYEHFSTNEKPCLLPKTCGNCSEPFHLAGPNDKCTKQPKCSNCKGPHSAWSRTCPLFVNQADVIKFMVDNKCSLKHAKNRMEGKVHNKEYSEVVAKRSPENKSTEDIEKKIEKLTEFFTVKIEQMMNVILSALPHLSQPISPPDEWLKSKMDVVDETDSAEEVEEDDVDIVPATPNQPTIQGPHYYTADYSNRGNNNPPAQHNRPQKRHSDKIKQKDTKKKKGRT